MDDYSYIKLESIILSCPGKTLSLSHLYSFIAQVLKMGINDLINQNYDECVAIINTLLTNNVISKRGTKTNKRRNKLSLSYSINNENFEFSEEDKRILMSLDKINTLYYKRRPKEFLEDKNILININSFLRLENVEPLSLNERSFELFGDEKAIKNNKDKGSQVQLVLHRIKSDYSIFKYVENGIPLLSFVFPNFYNKKNRNILIIENLDTYWSIHRVLTQVEHDIDMLIFGQGYNVVKNLKGSLFYKIGPEDNISYFGDIDLDGVRIFLQLKMSFNNLNITLNRLFYDLMLDLARLKGANKSASENQQSLSEEDLDIFFSYFDNRDRDLLREILLERRYIPQEAVNFSVLLRKMKGMGFDE